MRHPLIDVIVVGGGTAGAATALSLARAGMRATVIERIGRRRDKIGEFLAPKACVALQELGCWDTFSAQSHLQSPGVISCWMGRSENVRDYLFEPFGQAWQLDRNAFDEMLLRRAVEEGATVVRGAVRSCVRTRDGWSVSVAGERDEALVGRFVVDATGRSASIARSMGSTRYSIDRLIAYTAFVTPAAGLEDRRPLVEATPEGWWYTAGLPDGRLTASFMTDVTHARRRRNEVWRTELANTEKTAERLRTDRSFEIRPTAANTYWMNPPAGCDWIAVGDAAMAFDPLSAGGIPWALTSAIEAAEYIGATVSMKYTQSEISRRWMWWFCRYLMQRAYYYSREVPWPASRFWSRMRGYHDTRCRD